MRGRKPKPTAIKLLEGNPGKRTLNYAEPKPRVVLPRAPEHLSDEEKAKWKSTVKELYPLGLITAVDKDQLAMYCVYRPLPRKQASRRRGGGRRE